MKRAALLALAAFLGGCLPQVPQEAERYFILQAPPGAEAKAAVELAPTSAAGFYDTQDMAYSPAAGVRSYYQFNRWTRRPQRAIHAQLESRFPQDHRPGRPILSTHLDEIYHDAAQRPGAARITLTAQLSDPTDRSVIARRVFTASAPAASYDAPGAVRGFDQALGTLLDQIVAWVDARGAK